MGELFNLDNKFFQGLNKIVDCFWLSLLWCICCIPVAFTLYLLYGTGALLMLIPCVIAAVPAGVATTAMYYAINKVIRHGRGYVWKEFWHSFGTNLKQGALVTLIVAAIAAMMGGDGYIMFQFAKEGQKSGMLYVVFIMLFLFVTAWSIYIFPYMARFENTTKLILKNAGFIAIGNLGKTILMLALLAITAFAIYIVPFFIIILPAIYMLTVNIIMEKIFLKYMSEEDRAAEEERNRDFY